MQTRAKSAVSALPASSPKPKLPLREISSCRSASVPETRSSATMIQLVLLQRRNAPAQFVYDIVEMTDCILEAINSSRQAFISGLTGRLCSSISRRLGHGSTPERLLD